MSVKELLNIGLIWRENTGLFLRKCPKCHKPITHKGVDDRRASDTCRKAHLKKCVCRNCLGESRLGKEIKQAPVGVWKNENGHWCRKCPSCQNTLIHESQNAVKSKSKCIQAHNKQTKCYRCGSLNKKLPETVILSGTSSYKTFAYWTPEELLLLSKKGPHNTSQDLSVLFPRHSRKAIRTRCRRLGIPITDETRKRIAIHNRGLLDNNKLCKIDQTLTLDDLTNLEYQIIVGSLLGDSCVKKQPDRLQHRIFPSGRERNSVNLYRNFKLNCGHKLSHKPYLEWKAGILSRFYPRISDKLYSNNNGYPNTEFSAEFNTCQHPIFTTLRQQLYTAQDTNGRFAKASLPENLIAKIDLIGLLVWFLDDGCRPFKGNRKCDGKPRYNPVTIACKGYRLMDLHRTAEILTKKFGYNFVVSVSQAPHICYHLPEEGCINKSIRLKSQDSQDLIKQWIPIAQELQLPECMMYKLKLNTINPLYSANNKTNQAFC